MNFLKRELNILISDMSVKIEYLDLKKELILEHSIIKNGYILDKNYFYYILNKFLKDNKIKNNIDTNIYIISSDIINLRLEIPLIEDNEISSMIFYEIEDKYLLNLDHYKYKFKYTKNKNNIEVDTVLVPKEIVLDYIEIFKNLNLNLVGLFTFTEYLKDNLEEGLIVYLNISHCIILAKDLEKTHINTIFNEDISNLISENSLNLEDFFEVLENYENEIDDKGLKELRDKLIILRNNQVNLISSYINKYNLPIFFTENLYSVKIVEDLEKYNEIKFNFINVSEFKCDNLNLLNFIELKKERDFFKKGLIFIIIFLLIFNILVDKSIKNEGKRLEEEVITLKENISKNREILNKINPKKVESENKRLIELKEENNSFKKLSKSNKEFEDLVIYLENLEKENILITNYEFNESIMYIKGLVNDIKILDNIKKDIKHKTKLIENSIQEDGVISFKLEIELGD